MEAAADTDATALARDIAAAYPGQNEIELDGLTVTKMMGGNYRINDFPLAELSAAHLKRIRAAVRKRPDDVWDPKDRK
ncbi:MAG: hypothetical protein MUQ00_13540 [Candidatus Aminicenantes bacterium]|nr:hypothetical protein [Candidatus Aminicenantes bacterium]